MSQFDKFDFKANEIESEVLIEKWNERYTEAKLECQAQIKIEMEGLTNNKANMSPLEFENSKKEIIEKNSNRVINELMGLKNAFISAYSIGKEEGSKTKSVEDGITKVESFLEKGNDEIERKKMEIKEQRIERKKASDQRKTTGKGFGVYVIKEKTEIEEAKKKAERKLDLRVKLNQRKEEYANKKVEREKNQSGFKIYATNDKQILQATTSIRELREQILLNQQILEQQKHLISQNMAMPEKGKENNPLFEKTKQALNALVSQKGSSIDDRIARIQQQEVELEEKYPNYKVDRNLSFDERAENVKKSEKELKSESARIISMNEKRIKERKKDFVVAMGTQKIRSIKNHVKASASLAVSETVDKTKEIPTTISDAITSGTLWGKLQDFNEKRKDAAMRKKYTKDYTQLLNEQERQEREKQKEILKAEKLENSRKRAAEREAKNKAYKLSMLQKVNITDVEANKMVETEGIIKIASRVAAMKLVNGVSKAVSSTSTLNKYVKQSVVESYKNKAEKYQKLYNNFEQQDKSKDLQDVKEKASGFGK